MKSPSTIPRRVAPVLVLQLMVALTVWLGSCGREATAQEREKNVRDPITGKARIHTGEARRLDGSDPVPFIWGEEPALRAKYWWHGVPASERQSSLRPANWSNIRKSDYAGPDACKDCHASNYEKWMTHSHRVMNAKATPDMVKGDFSGTATMDYLGGKAWFFQTNQQYQMRLSRDGTNRTYVINRTIGSRYFQYYVGQLIAGPEPAGHPARKVDHLLPLGYWLDQKEWVPVVHIDSELPDGERDDAFARAAHVPYDESCAICHTTWPVGDWLLTDTGMQRAAFHSEYRIGFNAHGYLSEMHPNLLQALKAEAVPITDTLSWTFKKMNAMPVADHAVVLGVSCEACHNGALLHAKNSTSTNSSPSPMFFPGGPHVLLGAPNRSSAFGRNPATMNFICGRCHSGGRPKFAAGMATWNSVEFTDATLSKCFLPERGGRKSLSGLTCVHCHSPHQGIGPKWTKTPAEDDAKCLDCHKQYSEPAALTAHTHHLNGSEGSRCMNCHMPKINEGMQDVVRTHAIFNPTDARMIEANHPNACNLCHLKEPIDWTIRYLNKWYAGKAGPYSEKEIAANYPNRKGPVGLGWLQSPHEATRLVAVEALAKTNSTWALKEMLGILDDPYLLNRQFGQRRLEEMLGMDFRTLGYRFHQLPKERAEPLARVKKAVLERKTAAANQAPPSR